MLSTTAYFIAELKAESQMIQYVFLNLLFRIILPSDSYFASNQIK